MTRRPIFIGVATALALVLTAGLAYGAGRMMGARSPASQVAHQSGIVGTVPGVYFGSNAQARLHATKTFGQRRGWLRGQDGSYGWAMGRHFRSRARWSNFAGNGMSMRPNPQPGSNGYRGSGHGTHGSYHHNHMGTGSWGDGSGYHQHDCWGWR